MEHLLFSTDQDTGEADPRRGRPQEREREGQYNWRSGWEPREKAGQVAPLTPTHIEPASQWQKSHANWVFTLENRVLSAFLESILSLNPYKRTVFLAEICIFSTTLSCNGSCCGECREKGNMVLHLPWDFKIRGYEDSKSNRVLWDFVCLFVRFVSVCPLG